MVLPDIWFKMARFTVYDPRTRRSWETKEHGSTRPAPGMQQVTFEPFREPDRPTVEPQKPAPQFRVIHPQESALRPLGFIHDQKSGLTPITHEDTATTAAEDVIQHFRRLKAMGHNPTRLGPPMSDEEFYKAYQPWRK